MTTLTILYGFVASGWAADRVSVFVSIAPQRYFVQQIGKDLVDVQVLVEPGADPHTYEPKPKQMMALSKAALYFAIGIEFEAAKLGKITAMNPRMQVVHTDHGIMKLPMAAHGHPQKAGHHETAYRENGDHHHPGSLDPHIWLSPPLVMMQARSILTALQTVDPAHRLAYEANYRAFTLELVDLDAHLRETFDSLKGSSFMVFHPSWGTFAHTYGLKQVPIETEGKSPKPAQLKKLIEHARSNHIKVVFVQPPICARQPRN
ncbi:MAG: zinc ABC transporter substrate-binding protein [Desulfosarcina sp.]|nr:zinc ABC transporter substrate-binding protein [Desulfosarcina sp.]